MRSGGAFYPAATTALDFQLQQYRNGAGTYSVRDLSALPGWSFTRASAKTAQTSAGTVVSFASGVPAITDLGLLIEESRTNLLLQSQNFADAAWSVVTGGAKVGTSAVRDPAGGTNAYELSFTTGGSFSSASAVYQNATLTAAVVYTGSVWVRTKNGSTSSARLGVYNNTSDPGSSDQLVDGTWRRITYTAAAAGGGTGNMSIRPNAAGTTPNLLVWGAQLEAGAFATSYIPTTSAAVTRARDADALALNNPAAYAIVASFIAPIGQNGFANAFQWDDGTNNNRVLVNIAQSNSHAGVAVVSGGTTVASIDLGAITPGQRYTVAVRLAAGNYGASIAGGAVLKNAYASAPPATTTLRFGEGLSSNSPSNDLSGLIQRGIVYSSTPSDAQLQAWSAQ